MNRVKLRMTARQHETLRAHLFPGDGKEAVGVALCGRSAALETEVLVAHKIELVPYSVCGRFVDRIDWPPTQIEHVLREAAQRDLAILKVHSHPTGYEEFSATDDLSDNRVFESVFGWVEGDRPHASAIMLPGGRLIARSIRPDGGFLPINLIEVVGNDVTVWLHGNMEQDVPAFAQRHAQLFGEGTTRLLGALRIAVVGCSGTGSIVVEQLARLGVGELVLIDPDHVEEKNLNRILGATNDHARDRRAKVDVLAEHVARIGLGTRVHAFPTPLERPQAIRAVAASDLVVGCMDTVSGRNLLGRLARYYVLPYIDVGVKLEALEDGAINQVAGGVHYLQPDGLDLLDRGVITPGQIEAEDLSRTNPVEYRERLQRGYIRGVQVDRPAVISVNMCFASLAVIEILARLHPFRMDENAEFGSTRLSLSHAQLEHERDGLADERPRKIVGRGDATPLLDMPILGYPEDSET